jgi:hypothetical protein
MTPQTSGVEPATTKMNLDASSKTVTRTPKVAEPTTEARKWNTKNLGLRLAADAVSGLAAAILVAPLITIIDKYDMSLSYQFPRLTTNPEQ